MIDFFHSLFGDKNERELQKLWPIVEQINQEFAKLEKLTDDELRGKTDEFRKRISEAVAPIEQRKAEIRAELSDFEPDNPLVGDGAADGDG